jgi:hypothetical protein
VPRPTLRLPLLLPVILLVVSVAWQLYASKRPSLSLPAPDLTTDIPVALPGWSYRELPLAETEETRKAVVNTLQFDQFVSRIYQRESTTVTIYAAYWGPNKVPPRAVGVHTPDTCWIQNGWTRTARRHAVTLSLGGQALKPGEFGTYSLNGQSLNVLFWHLVGGEVYSYEQDGLHSLSAPLIDLLQFGLNQRRDQLFVRLACNEPFDKIWADPGFQQLLRSLSGLGLNQPSR